MLRHTGMAASGSPQIAGAQVDGILTRPAGLGEQDDQAGLAMRQHREQWLRKMQHKLPRPPIEENPIRNNSSLNGLSHASRGAGRWRSDTTTAPLSPETQTEGADILGGLGWGKQRTEGSLLNDSESQELLTQNKSSSQQQARKQQEHDGELMRKLWEKDRLIKGLQRNIDKLSRSLKVANRQNEQRAAIENLTPKTESTAAAPAPSPRHRRGAILVVTEDHESISTVESSKEKQDLKAADEKDVSLFGQTQISPRESARNLQLQAQLREAQTKSRNLSAEIIGLRELTVASKQQIADLEALTEALKEEKDQLKLKKEEEAAVAQATELKVRMEAEKLAQKQLLQLRHENIKALNELAASKGEVVVVRKQLMQANSDKRQTEQELHLRLRKAEIERDEIAKRQSQEVNRLSDLEDIVRIQKESIAVLEQKLVVKAAGQEAKMIPLEKLEKQILQLRRDLKIRDDASAFQRRQHAAEAKVLRSELGKMRAELEAAQNRISILSQDASKVSLERTHNKLREQVRANEDLGRRADRDRQFSLKLEQKLARQRDQDELLTSAWEHLRELLEVERSSKPQCFMCGKSSGMHPHQCPTCLVIACSPCAQNQLCECMETLSGSTKMEGSNAEALSSLTWQLDADLVARASQSEYRTNRLESILRALESARQHPSLTDEVETNSI